jgi:hypothetical protein
MFVAHVPTYVIDLGNDERLRWAEVIAQEKALAAAVIQEAAAEFERVPELLRWVFARLYRAFGGLYRSEIESQPAPKTVMKVKDVPVHHLGCKFRWQGGQRLSKGGIHTSNYTRAK